MAEATDWHRVGLIRLREHCTFSWQESPAGGPKSITVQATHCAECVAEARKLGYVVREAAGEPGR